MHRGTVLWEMELLDEEYERVIFALPGKEGK